MDAPAVESLHCSLSSTWIVVLDEAVVEPFRLELE